MLCLGKEDILNATTLDEIMDAVESAMQLYEEKDFHMPPRMHVDYEGNTLLLMPCFTHESFGTKLVSLFPDNPKKDLPVLMGVVILNDVRSGEPKALLNGATLTALRTGAVGGVSIRHLARKDVRTLGVVGAGVQGFYQSIFACTARNFSDIFIIDKYPEKADQLAENLNASISHVKPYPSSSVDDLLEKSDVVITATNSEWPVLTDNKDLLKGKHFVAIGSYKPEMKEYPQATFHLLTQIFIDTEHALEESGDLIDPLKNGWIRKEQIFTLGKLINGNVVNNPGETQTTLFKSVGMALFDVMVTNLIYEKAVQKGFGQYVDL